ncbi:MAG: thymidine phosphorylase [Kiritimatiellae bacterium]|nr:thymidine phosphorylase [Kiritimatiellia bacterium]
MAFVPQWLIEAKRDGGILSDEEIRFFIDGFTSGAIPDYQMAAMAMAIYFRGMTPEETASLTRAMMESGHLVDTSALPGSKVDKHSTGGIGDKVSLILAPLVACSGITVPMISGRGLGITGGTLDKLESIAGFDVSLSEERFLAILRQCGVCMIGQTAEIAPADKKLYALRDVTATVPSIPLITASIMCKKLAEGIDALVLDVKYGAGAFMKTLADAEELARSMVRVGRAMGKKVVAILSGMDQPLGHEVGNALEVVESLSCLRGERNGSDLMEITLALADEMLLLGGAAATPEEARAKNLSHLSDGSALAKFVEMAEAQGADVSVLRDPAKLPKAKTVFDCTAPAAGWVAKVDAESVGRAALVLGGGRQKTSDKVNFAVGISDLAKIGDKVEAGDLLARIHADTEEGLAAAKAFLGKAFEIAPEAPAKKPLIAGRIGE